MRLFLSILASLYHEDKLSKLSPIIQKILLASMSVFQILHICVLIWSSSANMEYLLNYQKFFLIFSHSGIDKLASASSVLEPYFYFIIALLISNILFVCFNFVLEFFGSKTPALIRAITKLSLFLTVDLLFIPCTYTLSMLLKYSEKNSDNLIEYEETVPGSIFNFGKVGIIISIFLLLSHLIISIAHTAFSFELNHMSKERSLTAKSTINQELMINFGLFILSFCYPLFQMNYYIPYLLSLSFFLCYCVYHHSFNLPYLSNFSNFIQTIKYLECFSLCIFFITAYFLNNALIILVLSIIMQPILWVSADLLIKWRSSTILKDKPESSYSRFEYANRQVFLGHSKDDNIIKISNSVYHITKNRLIRVIQAYYCLEVLNDIHLASIKISLASLSKSNIFTTFQIYKCAKIVKTSGLENSPGAKIHKFLSDHRYVLSKDKKYCLSFLDLIDKFHEESSTQSTLENLTVKTSGIIQKLKVKYEELLASYPDSSIIFKCYGSFLSELIGDSDLGQIYLTKSEKWRYVKSSKDKKIDVFSDESICILCTSAEGKNPGRILNANQGLCNFIEIEYEDLIGLNISDIIPCHNDFDIVKFISGFCEKCESHVLHVDLPFYLKDKKGFLKECLISTNCIGVEMHNQFVSVIQPKHSSSRNIALIYLDGTIFAHSEGFPQVFGSMSYKVEKKNIKEFVDNIDLASLYDLQPLLIHESNLKALLSFRIVKYAKVQVVILVCYTDDLEIDEIRSNDNNQRIKNRSAIINEKLKVNKVGILSYGLEYKNHQVGSQGIKQAGFEPSKVEEKETNALTSSSKHNFINSFEFKYITKVLKIFGYLKFMLIVLVRYI